MSVTWSETKLVRVDFPSMQPIKGHRRGDEVDLFHVRLPDEKGRTESGSYECVVDSRSAPFVTHVLNFRGGTRHPHLYQYSMVPGTTKRSLLVCQGDWRFEGGRKGPSTSTSGRIGGYLNHIINVLNS